jgi:hypothetical protein
LGVITFPYDGKSVVWRVERGEGMEHKTY